MALPASVGKPFAVPSGNLLRVAQVTRAPQHGRCLMWGWVSSPSHETAHVLPSAPLINEEEAKAKQVIQEKHFKAVSTAGDGTLTSPSREGRAQG